MNLPKNSQRLTLFTMLALCAGIGLGLILSKTSSSLALRLAEDASVIGTLWTNALRMVVVPLIVTTIIAGIAVQGRAGRVGRLTLQSFAVFSALLLLGVTYSVFVSKTSLSDYTGRLQLTGSLPPDIQSDATPPREEGEALIQEPLLASEETGA